MKSLKSASCVRVDKNDKELARNQIKPSEFSQELLEALEEADQIIKDIESGKRKGYTNIDEMLEAILKEDDEDED